MVSFYHFWSSIYYIKQSFLTKRCSLRQILNVNQICFINPFLVNGTIQLLGDEQVQVMAETWFVEADCDEVNIKSEMFQTFFFAFTPSWFVGDVVTISDQEQSQEYKGEQLVNQNASSTFSIAFKKASATTPGGKGFVLKWNCIK